MRKELLSPEEKEFLQAYQARPYHYFRDICRYLNLLRKLTK
ncbi:hypothetical protein [Streptococcus cuniculipharyngis]|nr:hypothetical protein [Streptococcus cuniculipharyngis]